MPSLPSCALRPAAPRREQSDYYCGTSAWTDVHPSAMLGPATCFKTYDLHTVTLEEIKAPLKVGGRRAACEKKLPAALGGGRAARHRAGRRELLVWAWVGSLCCALHGQDWRLAAPQPFCHQAQEVRVAAAEPCAPPPRSLTPPRPLSHSPAGLSDAGGS